jgi:signal transduction histidine kinase
MKSEFLLRLSDAVSENVENILGKALELKSGSEELAAYNSIDTIISTSQRLMTTFHEALDVARVETGRGDVRVEAVDPLAILRDVVAEESVAARKRGLDIRLESPGDLSASIEVNPRQARQVLAEFVRVAVHSTASGVLGVSCTTELTDDWRKPRLRVEVNGIGRGIRGEDRARIFDLFGSGKATRHEDVAPGLGIALAKRIADVLGWEIDLARDADGAPVFVVAFDVRVAGSPAPRT